MFQDATCHISNLLLDPVGPELMSCGADCLPKRICLNAIEAQGRGSVDDGLPDGPDRTSMQLMRGESTSMKRKTIVQKAFVTPGAKADDPTGRSTSHWVPTSIRNRLLQHSFGYHSEDFGILQGKRHESTSAMHQQLLGNAPESGYVTENIGSGHKIDQAPDITIDAHVEWLKPGDHGKLQGLATLQFCSRKSHGEHQFRSQVVTLRYLVVYDLADHLHGVFVHHRHDNILEALIINARSSTDFSERVGGAQTGHADDCRQDSKLPLARTDHENEVSLTSDVDGQVRRPLVWSSVGDATDWAAGAWGYSLICWVGIHQTTLGVLVTDMSRDYSICTQALCSIL
ncbi:hypothetical protein IAQ61_010677 [Plenodomus lingam]|uniref:uncharacterized protein n=1 Tax=Leptosphaeria maculans TaxID=5022 RepID=UPI00332D1B27|nr:hypothetical protein IAQ61_010677 [Plenodomus lingam]